MFTIIANYVKLSDTFIHDQLPTTYLLSRIFLGFIVVFQVNLNRLIPVILTGFRNTTLPILAQKGWSRHQVC